MKRKSNASVFKWSAFLAACALSLALLGCDVDENGNCFYDIPASVYPEGPRESARAYYPCNITSLQSVGATTVTNGKGGNKEGLYWLAQPIARNGIIACTVSALDNESEEGYEVAHRTGLGILAYANENSGSPIIGKIHAYGVIGYSIGGGAAINVASERGAQVQTCIGLSPYNPVPTANLRAATLILTCQQDVVAPPSMGHAAFNAIPANTPKAYASMVGQGHIFWWNNTNPGSADDYIIAWLKYWQDNNQLFASILEQPQDDMTDVQMEAAPLTLYGTTPQNTVSSSSSDSGGGGGCAIAVLNDESDWSVIYSLGESLRRWISSNVRW